MHRLIGRDHCDSPLGAVASPSRFSDPVGRFAVLYAAETVSCAFWEALARNRFTRRQRRELPLSDVAARVLVSLCSADALNLVDLRTDGPVRIGAPTAVAHDANHAAGPCAGCGHLRECAPGRRLSVSLEIHWRCLRSRIRQGSWKVVTAECHAARRERGVPASLARGQRPCPRAAADPAPPAAAATAPPKQPTVDLGMVVLKYLSHLRVSFV